MTLLIWTIVCVAVAIMVYRWWSRSTILREDIRNLTHELPYWTVRDGVVVLRDGSYQYGFEVRWPATDTTAPEEIEQCAVAVERTLNNAVPEGEDLRFVVDVRRASEEMVGHHADLGRNASGPAGVLYHHAARDLAQFCAAGSAVWHRLYVFGSYKPSRGAVRNVPTLWEPISAPRYRRHLQEIRVRKDMLSAYLQGAGMDPREVDSDELLALIWRYWNPASRYAVPPPRIPYDRDRLEFPRKTLEEVPEMALPSARNVVGRSSVVFRPDHMMIDSRYVKVITMDRLPAGTTWRNMYGPLLHGIQEGWLVIEISQTERSAELKRLEVKANLLYASRVAKEREDARASVQSGEVEEALRVAYSGDHRIFFGGVRAVLVDETLHGVKKAAQDVLRAFHSVPGVSGVDESLALWKGFRSASPCSGIPSHRRCKVFTPNAADFVPTVGPWGGSEKPVMVLGHRTDALIPFDPFDQRFPAWNEIIVGSTGSGKTHLANLLLLNLAPTGRLMTVVDRGGGYRLLTQVLGGQTVQLGPDARIALNPMDTVPGQIERTPEGYIRVDEVKVASLANIVGLMIARGGQVYTDREQIVVADAVRQTYVRLGDEGRPPLLSDLRDSLMVYQPRVDTPEVGTELRRTAGEVAVRLSQWVGDGVFARLFDRPTSVDLYGDDLLYFDTEGLSGESPVAGPAMAVLADVAWRRAQRPDILGSIFVWDEAWAYMRIPEAAHLIEEMYRRLRRYRGMVLAITQQPDDLLDSPAGQAILNNSQIWWLLRGAYSDRILDAMRLNPRIQALLGQLTRVQGLYSEAVLSCDVGTRREGDLVVVRPSSAHYWVATSDRLERESRDLALAHYKDPLQGILEIAAQNPRGLGLAARAGRSGQALEETRRVS
jgi:hypothetical protein